MNGTSGAALTAELADPGQDPATGRGGAGEICVGDGSRLLDAARGQQDAVGLVDLVQVLGVAGQPGTDQLEGGIRVDAVIVRRYADAAEPNVFGPLRRLREGFAGQVPAPDARGAHAQLVPLLAVRIQLHDLLRQRDHVPQADFQPGPVPLGLQPASWVGGAGFGRSHPRQCVGVTLVVGEARDPVGPVRGRELAHPERRRLGVGPVELRVQRPGFLEGLVRLEQHSPVFQMDGPVLEVQVP
jgi:hypothetical protein